MNVATGLNIVPMELGMHDGLGSINKRVWLAVAVVLALGFAQPAAANGEQALSHCDAMRCNAKERKRAGIIIVHRSSLLACSLRFQPVPKRRDLCRV